MIVRGSTPRGLSLAGKLIILALALALPLVPSPARSAADPKTDKAEATATAEDKAEHLSASALEDAGELALDVLEALPAG